MTSFLSMRGRAVILVLYVAILCVFNNFLFGELVPTKSWLLVSFVPFLVANLIVQPHFTAPGDSFSNSVISILVMLPLLFGSESIPDASREYWLAGFIASLVILAMSSLVILLDKFGWQQQLANTLKLFSAKFGSPKFIFTVIHFLILQSFHTESDKIILLALFWILVVFGRPIENTIILFRRSREIWHGLRRKSQVIGEVVSRHHPRLLTIQVAGNEHPDVDSLVIVPISNSSCQVGVVLDNYRLAEELWTKALILKDEVPTEGIPEIDGPTNVALKCDEKLGSSCWGLTTKISFRKM